MFNAPLGDILIMSAVCIFHCKFEAVYFCSKQHTAELIFLPLFELVKLQKNTEFESKVLFKIKKNKCLLPTANVLIIITHSFRNPQIGSTSIAMFV